jgi:hypothetical protein
MGQRYKELSVRSKPYRPINVVDTSKEAVQAESDLGDSANGRGF